MTRDVTDDWLAGLKVAVLVWNGFQHDARVRREAMSLVRRGAQVRVICIQTDAALSNREVDDGIEVVRVGAESSLARWFGNRAGSALSEVKGSIGMLRQVLSFRPNVVHSNDVNTLVPAWLGARATRAGLVYDAHEISADREGYRGRTWLVMAIERTLGNRADARMTTTRSRAQWFADRYGFEKVHVVQNRPDYNVVTSDLIRTRYHIPESDLVVLYQGGLQPGRGLRNLVLAAQKVRNLRLVFVGEGRQRAELETLAEGYGDRIHFAGIVPLEELPFWTASADVGVQVLRNTCLNHFTTDSNKLFEYVMGGLPVIASDFPEIRNIVASHDLGLLVDPEDVEALAHAMGRFVEDSGLRAECRRNALDAREELHWGSQEGEFLAAYREAVSRD